ncbi:MAG: HAD family hydrolase [Deltaproteobacteria bacterium]|nr:HAD family hydrolase [Deltaproteobacteria bacterium]MBW2421830.1 HAD family hydrolase [Deltaproteobacteria bacterium]
MLALDFDGVISDSALEAFVVAARSHLRMRSGSLVAARLGALVDGPGAPDPRRIRADPLFQDFVELMPLGNRAEDYEVILAALESGVDLPDQAAYDAFYATHAPDFLADYHRCFYAERSTFAEKEPRVWESLMQPYAEIVDLLRGHAGRVELAIATAKDRASVLRLLHCYGLADLFAGDRLLDKEMGRSKRAHLERLQQRWGGDFEQITFVDDKVNHLDAVADLGLRCVLAAWGYNGRREHELARERGYQVCELARAERVLFG